MRSHCEERSDEAISHESKGKDKDCFAEFILSVVEGLLRNTMPTLHHTPWIPAFAGMTKTTRPSFRASTARPGIQESPVSASTLSAPCYGRLAMTTPHFHTDRLLGPASQLLTLHLSFFTLNCLLPADEKSPHPSAPLN